MQWAHTRHTHCAGHEVYMDYKLLEIFEGVISHGFKSW
jgi:hypothetical protein